MATPDSAAAAAAALGRGLARASTLAAAASSGGRTTRTSTSTTSSSSSSAARAGGSAGRAAGETCRRRLCSTSRRFPRHFRDTSEILPREFREIAPRERRGERCATLCAARCSHIPTRSVKPSHQPRRQPHLTTTPPHHHHGHHRHTATPPPHDTVHTTVHTTPSTRHARPQVAVGVEKSVSWRTAEGTETAEVRLSRCGRCAPVLERALEGARARLRSVSAAAACAV